MAWVKIPRCYLPQENKTLSDLNIFFWGGAIFPFKQWVRVILFALLTIEQLGKTEHTYVF